MGSYMSLWSLKETDTEARKLTSPKANHAAQKSRHFAIYRSALLFGVNARANVGAKLGKVKTISSIM